jgi:gliding motility-associated-like protein
MKRLSSWHLFLRILLSVVIVITVGTLSAQTPTITSFTPTSGPIGTTVEVTGTNFSTAASDNIVWFGAVRATVTTASATELTITIPAGTTYQPISVTVNGLTAWTKTPFNVTFPGTHEMDESSFSHTVDFNTGANNPYGVAIGDIDGDGKPDMVVTNHADITTSVFRNISSSDTITLASFSSKVDLATGFNTNGVAIGDIDGDGKQDIVVTNGNNNTFDSRIDFTTGTYPNSVAIRDIDGDGKPDIVVANENSNTVSIFRNISSPGSITAGSLAPRVDFITGSDPTSIAIGDIDGDGQSDMVVANGGNNFVSIFRNIGSSGSITAGSFAPREDIYTGNQPSCVIIGDIDGDNKPDLAVTNLNSNTVSVFRNIASPGSIILSSFEFKVDYSTGSQPHSAVLGDINGDGRPDLAVINKNSNSVSVFRNTSTSGSITFATKINYSTGMDPYSIAMGDIEGDGKLDLVVTNVVSGTVRVHRNTIQSSVPPVIGSIAPTSAQVGSTITISGSNFNITPTKNIVWFGAVRAAVTAATATQLSVTVPAGATYQPITVTDMNSGLTAYSNTPFNVTFTNAGFFDASSFAEKVDITTGTNPGNSAIGDINGDGKPDLAYIHFADRVSVRLNSCTSGSIPSGSFDPQIELFTEPNPSGFAIGDIDGDGRKDIIVTNGSASTLSIFRNTTPSGTVGWATFAPKVDIPTGGFSQSPAIRDIDGDGKSDIIVANNQYHQVSIFRNMSTPGNITTGSFAPKVDFNTGTGPWRVAFDIGDLDGDGKPDLALAYSNTNTVSIFRNTSTPGSITTSSFADKVDFATGANPWNVVVGDIDGDGKLDLSVTNFNSNTVSVFRNTATSGSITAASFATMTEIPTGLQPIYTGIADINGDGKPDLVVIRQNSNTVSIFRNIGTSGSITSASFDPKVDFTSYGNTTSVAIGDLDCDGKPDLFVTNGTGNSVSVFRNLVSELPPPSPPVINSYNPTSGAVGTSVIISGSNFSSTSSENIVWFGAVKATVIAATSTSLSVTVPIGATYQPITVTVNGLTAWSGAPFTVTFPGTGVMDATAFAAKVDCPSGTAPSSAGIIDIDGDGKPDLVVTNYGGASVSVFRNVSTSGSVTAGSFSSKVDFNTGTGPNKVAISDIDGDGKPDLVVTNYGSNTVSVFRNTSSPGSITSGSFAAKVDLPSVANPGFVTTGDIDGDGKPDLVVTSFSSSTVSVFRNISTSGSIETGSFAPKIELSTGTGIIYAAIGDIDGDGKPDLVVANFNSSTVSVFRNISTPGSIESGSFAAKVDLSTGMGIVCVVISDIDSDGKPDLTVLNNYNISIFRNTSTSGSLTESSFAAKVDFPEGTGTRGIAIGDIDGDGKPDLAVAANTGHTVSIFRNNSVPGSLTTSSLAPKVSFYTGTDEYSIVLGDIDGDGKPDLVVANSSGNTVSVLRNKISEPVPPVITSFTPTSGPIGTAVSISGLNFSTTPSNNIVWFGAVQGTVTAATSTSLSVNVPIGTTYQPISVTVNGLSGYSRTPFIITFQSARIFDLASFDAKFDFPSGANPTFASISDIDGDGKPDLVVTNQSGNTISVFRNISTSGSISAGSFAPKVDFITGTTPKGITVGDIDGDNKPDLVVANYGDNTVSVFRNTSSPGSITTGSFAAKVDFPVGPLPDGIAIGDIDSDGKPDIVVAGSNYYISVYKNTSLPGSISTGSFALRVDLSTGTTPVYPVIGDIDGDGKPDLAVANMGSNTVSVFRNNNTPGSINAGSFDPRVDFPTGNSPFGVAICDIDGDAKNDLGVVCSNDSTLSVFRNIGVTGSITTGTFMTKVNFKTDKNPNSIAVGDLDGDGKPDIAITNVGSNTVSLFRNTSSPGSFTTSSFASKVNFVTSSGPRVVIGDIDGDGRPDMVISNLGENSVSVLRNRISELLPPVISSFTPASGPVGTTVTISGSNFSTNISNNIVKFGTVQAAVISATATQLTVIVPAGATNQPIYVTINELTAYTNTSFIVTFTPVITSFTPISGPVGTTVTIEGTNFGTTPSDNIVLFGTVQAAVSAATSTQLAVIVPVGATTQLIYVTANGLTANSGTSFTITAPTSDPPVITSFTPASGPVGTTVTISGSNFSTNISNNIVRFGTVQAAVISATATQLTVIVPAGATNQPIYVTVNGLTAYTNTSFIVTFPPVIASFTPISGPVGTTVTIEGTNFCATPADNIVLFGTVQAAVLSATATQLTVIVPAGATTQPIYVTANGLTANSGTSFTVTAPPSDPPVITTFNPASGPVGTTVTISGSNFSTNISNNIVRFGTVQAAVISATATQLTVIVPTGATTQPIYVTVNGLTAYTSVSYIVNSPPVIMSFSPTSGPVGISVTIYGTNLGPSPSDNIVLFGTVTATITAATATQLTVIVPAGATTQPISVTVNGLTSTSIASFTVTIPPAIISFSPASGPVGSTVTISGSNFSSNISNNIVKFGTVQSAVISATTNQLSVIVPAGATTQPIYVTVNGLTAYTTESFIINFPPVIASFNPPSGYVGTNVTIIGSNFSTTAANNIVRFGTVQATVTTATETQITVTVPPGATTQPINVSVNGLTAYSSNPFNVTFPQQPFINSFTPTSGPIGTTVTINGSNFSTNIADNNVFFGGIQATVTAASTTQLTVTVPDATGNQIIAVTVNGLTANSNNSFNITSTGENPSANSFVFESSVITLNGDGINDRLVIQNFETYGKCDIYVYNSRGILIFSQKDYQNDWDMSIKGRILETGGYFYVAETESGVFRGSFSILKQF